MLPPHGVSLATNIITSHFGDLVAKTCACLLRKRTLTFQELARYTEIRPAQLKNCLLVLIQHNCVQAFAVEKSGLGLQQKAITHYMALFDNILHRLRFPKFLALVSERCDKALENIMEGLFQHGRLSVEQILMRATSTQMEGDAEILRSHFGELVQAHFIERCPRVEPLLQTDENEPGAKRPKFAGMPPTIEQRAIKAAALSEAERFSFASKNIDENSLVNNSSQPKGVTAGKKRKRVVPENDNIAAAFSDQEVLWRPNFEEFVRCFRNKACVEKVQSNFDPEVATVLSVFLDAAKNPEKVVREERSVSLSMDALVQEAMGRQECPHGIEQIRAALDKLGASLSTDESSALYTIDVNRFIEDARNSEVESVLSRKYGSGALRVFRLLVRKKRLIETEQISDETLIDKKETVHILFRLLKDNFLHVERIDARDAKSRYFLWKVEKDALWKHVLDDALHAASNLRQRLSHELEQEHEVISRPRDQLDEVQLKRLQRIIKVRTVLESSLLKLDDAIMLFNDFCCS